MNCLYRGLGNAAIVKDLREFAKKVAPTVLYVVETQVHQAWMEGLKGTLGFDNAFALSSSRRKGGLDIFWNDNTRVELLKVYRKGPKSAGFRDAVDVCGLVDLGLEGLRWTYEKKVARGSLHRVECHVSIRCGQAPDVGGLGPWPNRITMGQQTA